MHYKNGRQAANGDPVVGETWKASGKYLAGTIHSIQEGSTSCNCQVAVPQVGGCSNFCTTCGELYHAEDAFKSVQPSIPVSPPA